jgi:CelD/BcsL family acetyltransferase involved in cellulose biosynthesis
MSIAESPVATSARLASIVVSAYRGGVEVVERWADDWRELCLESIDDQPFYHPEWIAAHIRAFTPKANVLLLMVTCEGRLHLVLPLLEERALFYGLPVRRLRAPVNGHTCRFDAVRSPGPEGDLALQVLWEYLKTLPTWDLLEVPYMPIGGTLSALALAAEADDFQTAQLPMSPNPYVPIPPDSQSLCQLPVNKKLRSQLRGIRNALAKKGQLRLQRVDAANSAILQRFYELESAGWKGADGTAIAYTENGPQFYNEISNWAESLGCLCIYTLELDDQLLAAHFGLSYRGRYFSPKVAYNENFKPWAPGHLIVDEILRDCVARQVHEYDITGQNDDWKAKWTSNSRPQCIQYIFRKGISGSIAHALGFRLRPGVLRLRNSVMSKSGASRVN